MLGVPRVDIERLQLDGLRFPLARPRTTTVRANANVANGMFLGCDGRLVVCEQGTFTTPARISLVDRATGDAERVVDSYGGYPLSSPNDVVVHPDGPARRRNQIDRPTINAAPPITVKATVSTPRSHRYSDSRRSTRRSRFMTDSS